MTLLVDAAAGAVVDGERRWPLRLDCRTGAAVVTFGDRELAIAPLQWRHKQRLARWAHLGPDFVTSQRAALALDPAEEWDDDDIRVVAAVAEFLDGATLPLAPDLLAEVAIEACRATGLAPAAFDDRDAYDVESIWRVGSGAAPAAPQPTTARAVGATGADPWADSTSIVLVADPPLEVRRPEADPDPDDRRRWRRRRAARAPARPRRRRARGDGRRHLGLGRPPDVRRDPGAAVDARASRRPAVPRRARRSARCGTPSAPPRRPSSPRSPIATPSPPTPPARRSRPALTSGTAADTLGTGDAWAANEVTTAGGPLIAPAAPTSTIARRQPGRWDDLAVADAFPSRPAPGTEIDDDDARLDELVDAVAARLADQLAMTSDDLGIEV